MKTPLLLLTFAIAWLCLGCCKSETYYVDQAVIDFTVFQPGSWWVYVDSVSGRRDSVVVSILNSGFTSDMTKQEGCYDKLEYYSYAVEVFNWANDKEYIQITPADELTNTETYDIHDLLRFYGGTVNIKWNETNHIYTPIGVYDRSQNKFTFYEYSDTLETVAK